MESRIVVVGASLAGLRITEQLRRAGFAGKITVVGEEPHFPYNRPPLSKEFLSSGEVLNANSLAEELAFGRKPSVSDVDFKLGVAVESCSLDSRQLRLTDGTVLDFDGLAVATGVRPRRLPVEAALKSRFTLRTVEDCVALRAAVKNSRRAVVIGGGFIGCEAAATLNSMGLEVTIVEPMGAPLARALGVEIATTVQRFHEEKGISFRIGESVERVEEDGGGTQLTLSSGETLYADFIVESVGSLPNVEWLQNNSSLDLSNGILCDSQLRVHGAAGVVALGDVARFENPGFGGLTLRIEHWSMAGDAAKQAASTLIADLEGREVDSSSFEVVPSFWSDQGELHIQSVGLPGVADEFVILEGEVLNIGEGLKVLCKKDGVPCGVFAINLPSATQFVLRNTLKESQLVQN